MPHFIPNPAYNRLLIDLREAARAGDWRSAIAEALAGADVLPEVCRGDFAQEEAK